MGKKFTTEEFVKRAKAVHGNTYDYSKSNYINSYTKLIIICSKHGEFSVIPNNHLRGSICYKCAKEKLGLFFKLSTKEFIKRAKKIHENKYDYNKSNYVSANIKVVIHCNIHGDFKQKPASHLRGHGCSKCIPPSKFKKTKEKFICDANKIHNGKYNYSEVHYVNNHTKVKIICPNHDIFLQIPKSHLKGRGCPKCAKNYKLTTDKFIESANKIHNNKYDYSKVKLINTYTDVTILCTVHNYIFKQKPTLHLSGSTACPKCLSKKSNSQVNTEIFILRANLIHNKKYDYSMAEYKNTHSKVIILCPKHKKFKQTPHNHLIGQGCPKCGKEKAGILKRLNNDDFIKKAIKIHENKYDYSKVDYLTSRDKVIIGCNIHGYFAQAPTDHLQGKGCHDCAGTKNLTTEEFINMAKLIHDDAYDYSKVNYNSAHEKIIIICPTHGEFLQKPNAHVSKQHGCPHCVHTISKPEIQWLNFLNIPKKYRGHKKVKVGNKIFKCDALYNKKIYEFYGSFWHGDPNVLDKNGIQKFPPQNKNPVNNKLYGQLYKETLEREHILKEAGYTIISIWEREWKEFRKNIEI